MFQEVASTGESQKTDQIGTMHLPGLKRRTQVFVHGRVINLHSWFISDIPAHNPSEML